MSKAPIIHHQPTGAGKGDKSRVNDIDAYRKNYERIFRKANESAAKALTKPMFQWQEWHMWEGW